MLLTIVPLFGMMTYLFWNRYSGLGFFDASEFAAHIQSGGIPHAPGYPIYLLLGKFLNFFCRDPFLAQNLISLSAFPVILASLYQTIKISERGKRTTDSNPCICSYFIDVSFFVLPQTLHNSPRSVCSQSRFLRNSTLEGNLLELRFFPQKRIFRFPNLWFGSVPSPYSSFDPAGSSASSVS